MREFYRKTFGKAGALAYVGEGLAHIYVVLTGFSLTNLPFWADWYFVILSVYCGIGLLWFAYSCEIERRRCCDGWAYVLTTLMTVGPAALHTMLIAARSHEILHVFSRPYSVFGLMYSIFFAWWLWTLRLKRA